MRNDYLFKNKCYEWKNSKKVFIFSYCANKCCNSNVVTSSEGEISSNFSKARCQWNCLSLPMTQSPKKEAAALLPEAEKLLCSPAPPVVAFMLTM